jgi:hypothetical protein
MGRLHNKAAWHRRARRQLQYEPLCAMCLSEGKIVAARIADHYTAKGSLSAQGNERQQHPRAIARASAAKQREIDLGRSEKRKLSIL